MSDASIIYIAWVILFVGLWWGINRLGNRSPTIASMDFPARTVMEGIEAMAMSVVIVTLGCLLVGWGRA